MPVVRKYTVTLETESDVAPERTKEYFEALFSLYAWRPITVLEVTAEGPRLNPGAVLLLDEGSYQRQTVAEVDWTGKKYSAIGFEKKFPVEDLNAINYRVLFDGYPEEEED